MGSGLFDRPLDGVGFQFDAIENGRKTREVLFRLQNITLDKTVNARGADSQPGSGPTTRWYRERNLDTMTNVEKPLLAHRYRKTVALNHTRQRGATRGPGDRPALSGRGLCVHSWIAGNG